MLEIGKTAQHINGPAAVSTAVRVSAQTDLAAWAAADHAFSMLSLHAAANAFTDVIACMIGGMTDPAVSAVVAALEDIGDGHCYAFGSRGRLAAPWAALVNGTAAHALDFDDNFAPAFTHATAVLAPALLALAQAERLSGRAVLKAYIVGLELQARIGRIMQPAHYQRGWHSTSTIGAIGTAGACARLLGGNGDQVAAALAVATSMAGGSKVQFGSLMKPIHAGLAAKNAVLAARMAMAGVKGSDHTLEGEWGYPALVGGDPSAERMLEGLGESLAIDTDGLLAKLYPCCGAVHRTLDGIALLRLEPAFDPNEVDHVVTSLPDMALRNLRFDCPQDAMQARFSGTYCMARMLLTGRLELKDFSAEAIADTQIRSWLPRMHLVSYDDAKMTDGGRFDAITRIHMKDGRVLETTVDLPRGAPGKLLTRDDLAAKFASCCEWSGRADMADRLLPLAEALAETQDISKILAEMERHLVVREPMRPC